MRRSLGRAFPRTRKQQRSTEAAPDSAAATSTPCPPGLSLVGPSTPPRIDSTSPAFCAPTPPRTDSTSPAFYEPGEVSVSVAISVSEVSLLALLRNRGLQLFQIHQSGSFFTA